VNDATHARLLTRDGKILRGKYFLTHYFLRGLAPVAVEQDNYGYADNTGKLRIPAQYRLAECFRGPLAVVTRGSFANATKHWITTKGDIVGDPIEYTHGFTEDLAWIYRYDIKSYGCIDGTAKAAFGSRFHATAAFSGGLAAVVEKENGKWGYCDRSGSIVIPAKFDEAHPFSEERAVVKLGKKYRLVNARGKLLGEELDGVAGAMSEGMIAIRKTGKWGFIDKNGKLAIPPRYQEAYGFFEDRAYVRLKNAWGHIDRSGKNTIPITLEWTNRYRDGVAPAKMGGLAGFIDRDGKWVVPPIYHSTQPMFTDGLAWFRLP
jgi:hypothetical protein